MLAVLQPSADVAGLAPLSTTDPKPMLPNLRRHLAIAVLAIFVALALAGCTRVRLAYNTADLFITHYVESNIGLTSAQLANWRPTLDEALARHRRDELPYLAAFFDTAWREARRGLDERAVDCLLGQFQTIYRQHATLTAAVLAPLLAEAGPQQIDRLERQFREDLEEDAAHHARPQRTERSARNRAKRYGESAEWWIGPLNDAQRAIIAEITAEIPDTAERWTIYRYRKQSELIGLLRRGADAATIETFLTDWMVEHRDLPPDLRRIREEVRTGIGELLVRLDATFSAEQRTHFTQRLKALRDDFMTLQRQPRLAPVHCADA
ncbi:hypothetical protein CKO41_03595 [Thiococcus pfennigii]|jgi:hypothetical protein|nr:hypothetical protein [Thiococcus pfennigii]MBK1730901.1 hypothetical protein [Thiococcus pfennigii]